jgi:hypothetical protein
VLTYGKVFICLSTGIIVTFLFKLFLWDFKTKLNGNIKLQYSQHFQLNCNNLFYLPSTMKQYQDLKLSTFLKLVTALHVSAYSAILRCVKIWTTAVLSMLPWSVFSYYYVFKWSHCSFSYATCIVFLWYSCCLSTV